LRKGRDPSKIAEAAARAGADAIQLRDKKSCTADLIKDALAIKGALKGSKTLFLINDRVDVALCCGANGVHLGSRDMPPGLARKLIGDTGIIGVSADNPVECRRAEKMGADYIGLGPVFKTSTKSDAGRALGCEFIGKASLRSGIPVLAIGGIKKGDIKELVKCGVRWIAVGSGILNEKDVYRATASFKSILKREIRRVKL
jgi:thiamine-phosphate diphosphorylase